MVSSKHTFHDVERVDIELTQLERLLLAIHWARKSFVR